MFSVFETTTGGSTHLIDDVDGRFRGWQLGRSGLADVIEYFRAVAGAVVVQRRRLVNVARGLTSAVVRAADRPIAAVQLHTSSSRVQCTVSRTFVWRFIYIPSATLISNDTY